MTDKTIITSNDIGNTIQIQDNKVEVKTSQRTNNLVQSVDDGIFVQDAPLGTDAYGRRNGAWVKVTQGGGSSTEYTVNDIGVPGAYGFGVGIAPEENLPEGMKELHRTKEAGSPNYGNYIYEPDSSIMCWVPQHYYRWGHPASPNFEKYGNNALDIVPITAFQDRDEAQLSGFAIDRACIDGGIIQPGYFVDKYICSKNGNVQSSVQYGQPLSTNSGHNPISGLGGGITNIYGDTLKAAKTRGEDFFPGSIFIFTSIQRLSIQQAQGSKSTAMCQWYDGSGVMNFPKGCNNDNLRDVNDSSVLYQSDGYQNCGRTGSGVPFEKTTHNGQACGIQDISGPMWQVALGITVHANKYYVLKESTRMQNLTGSNTKSTDAFGANGVQANYDEVGSTWGDLRQTSAQRVIGHQTNRTYSDQTSGIDYQMASQGVPLAGGVGGNNILGNDGFWDYRPDECFPIVFGPWLSAGLSGPGARHFYYSRSSSSNSHVGLRSALYPVS